MTAAFVADESVSRDALCERLGAGARATGRVLRVTRQWLYVERPGTVRDGHGWKLHISARPSTLGRVLQRALDVLLAVPCDFKAVPGSADLARMNSGDHGNWGLVGKALTVYPDQQPDILVEVAARLADALSGLEGPTIRSDRRLAPGAPVYYRYGPFAPCWRADGDGAPVLIMRGPGGEEFPGQAGAVYRCPPWARDPFAPSPSAHEVGVPAEGSLLGGRYQLEEGVQQSVRGAVYRARDTTTGRDVIVKQGFAWAGETADGFDARILLRNERRVLAHLRGAGNTPCLVDHFRHGADEYLVTADVGKTTLGEDVHTNGAYTDPVDRRPPAVGRADGATLAGLGRRLLAALDTVHQHGVIVRDLAPKNIVLSEDGGRLYLVDLGIAALHDIQRPGHTPGYAPPRQRSNPPACVEDDYYALGATLCFAATGVAPAVRDNGLAPDAERTLAWLAEAHPALADGSARATLALIPDLLAEEPERRTRAAHHLRTGSRPANTRRMPRTSAVTSGVDKVTDQLLDTLHRYTEQLTERTAPPGTSLFTGTAGVAWELLNHPDDTSRHAAYALAAHTARHSEQLQAPAGWLFGATGTAVLLAIAARTTPPTRAAITQAELTQAAYRLALPDPALLPPAAEVRDDCTHGLAGIGIAHLQLADLLGDDRHRDVADACLDRLLAGNCTITADIKDPDEPGTGHSVRHGHAHGTAGLLAFLLAHQATGPRHPAAEETAHRWCTTLAERIEEYLAATRSPGCRPLALSWCQGLPGIGTTLLHAGGILHRPEWVDLATRAGHTAALLAPRTTVTSQCCGLSGLGQFLIDLATVTGNTDFTHHAHRVAALVTDRCLTTGEAELSDREASYGYGTAGTLAFLRRLKDPHPSPEGPRGLPLPTGLFRP
ncbi:class IV lanthionine synthetase LanL [Streptomyces sp. SudanB182_2057]|uniref:class IV lanthionine synthetase LanL n=1 Tax=Streptomyces sp. SudanB182_2057 TaxID=3035281 RepID=UPI003F564958